MLALRYLWVNWYYRKHRHVWRHFYGPFDVNKRCLFCGFVFQSDIEYGR